MKDFEMTEIKTVKVGNIEFANNRPFALLAGPCAIESRQHALEMSAALKELSEGLGIGLVYKSSFDKANRTSSTSRRGVGLVEGLDILAEVKEKTGLPIVTDVHLPDQCAAVAEVADILQIPAFLCRQADLLQAAGKTGRAVNVKKGQFLAPWDMANVANNIASTGNENIMLCDRGTSFGYNTLVTDFRGLPTMARQGYPVVFDATHSVQQPGGQGTTTGGQREFAPVLARAAVSVGIAALFIETHDNPDAAISDGPNQIPLNKLPEVLSVLMELDKVAKANPVRLDMFKD
ncbi:2-dehydro-3-deoxyphosphooctonate aldolase (KDO 8-P synthase) [Thalassospira xiamenensis M-5 = DSM 17429]|uniref:2-dehydro-3-deoxyphosphooctonate aldolase n=2 Tax=Thalassospira xiamenensis TaxID=220697 RepID=A0AB72UDT7_9PROT|nr:2-dehydro-3-deoxyphosphooctonate aldolase [Thalassospira xiamenensis M-5 = DSM 17429]SIS89735.1 2-dehydro-3-deoxyphosphooctonate aldolase (KDO 8-P synthase) [Thalassospira xiamenensis M-5 = DSM 17429]